MKLNKKCSCDIEENDCEYIKKILKSADSLREGYSTEQIQEIVIVSNSEIKQYSWERKTECYVGYAKHKLSLRCDFIKSLSLKELRKLLIEEMELDRKDGDTECFEDCRRENVDCDTCRCSFDCCDHCGDLCYGDCKDDDVSCDECRCSADCCDHCGEIECCGDCKDEDVSCDNCDCPEECCERCGDPCYGDCEDEDMSCDDCRCSEDCCERCRGQDSFNSLSPEEKLDLVCKKMEISKNQPVKIINDSTINGFTDGKEISITRGAIENLSEEELAFIVGHEKAHIQEEHINKTKALIRSKIHEIEVIAGDKNTKFFKKALKITGKAIMGVGAFSNLSHQQEHEADCRATEMLKKKGYTGIGGGELMDRFNTPDRGSSLTHPHPELRKKKME